MDPISTVQSRLSTLEAMSNELGERLTTLTQQRLGVEGGIAALTQVIAEVEGHKRRLEEEGAKQAKDRQAELVHVHSGINDALAYARVNRKSAQSNAYTLWGRHQEAQRTREMLATQGREEAGRLAQMMAELERGVDREMVGRPRSAAEVQDDIARRRIAAEEAAVAEQPAKKKRRRRAASAEEVA